MKLAQLHPSEELPAASTIGEWLRKEGLTRPRRRRRSTPPYGQPFATVTAANDVWCVDFKGWFRTADGARCDPLTISDAFSRYLLCCQGVAHPDHDHVARPSRRHSVSSVCRRRSARTMGRRLRRRAQAACRHWRCGGSSLASPASGSPGQAAAERAPRAHAPHAQGRDGEPAGLHPQRAAAVLRSLPPGVQCRPSARGSEPQDTGLVLSSASHPYPCALREPVYGDQLAVRRVRSNGEIKWSGELIFISEVLVGELVGIAETDNGEWLVRFANVELGFLTTNGDGCIADQRRSSRRRPVDLWTTQERCPQPHRSNSRRPKHD